MMLSYTCSIGAAFRSRKFTGKERDAESGLDYFLARYYNSNMGRFMSPDWSGESEAVPYAHLMNPQSLNLYSYVYNNPLSLVDPDGHGCFDDIATSSSDTSSADENGNTIETLTVNGNCSTVDLWGTPSYSASPLQQQITQKSAPPNLPGTVNIPRNDLFTCASEFASKYSIAGGLQTFGIGTSGLGGFITNALGGNAFSGLTDLIQSLGSGEGGGHSVFYNMGLGVAAGPTQGFGAAFGGSIEGTPWASGASDVATGAIAGGGFSAVTGAGQGIQTLNGISSLASTGIDAAEFASGVGIAKLAYDLASYSVGLVHCY